MKDLYKILIIKFYGLKSVYLFVNILKYLLCLCYKYNYVVIYMF